MGRELLGEGEEKAVKDALLGDIFVTAIAVGDFVEGTVIVAGPKNAREIQLRAPFVVVLCAQGTHDLWPLQFECHHSFSIFVCLFVRVPACKEISNIAACASTVLAVHSFCPRMVESLQLFELGLSPRA